MKTKFLLTIVITSLLIMSCNKNHNEFDTAQSAKELDNISAAATVQDPNKKFIHTADINLEVKNVLESTLNIEKNVLVIGGYISKSNLQSNIISNIVKPISKDSAQEIKIYNVTNQMIVRVPQSYLSDFLYSLNKETRFLNYRIIEANDVTINAEALNLDENRLKNTQNKLNKTLDQDGKVKEKKEVISSLDTVKAKKDIAYISKKILNDKIELATVSIELKEQNKIKETIIANTEDYNLYTKSNFGYGIKIAFIKGIDFLQSVIIGLFYLWPFWILLISGIVIYKNYKKK